MYIYIYIYTYLDKYNDVISGCPTDGIRIGLSQNGINLQRLHLSQNADPMI